MSKGPGRVEQAIRELFSANPREAFTSGDLVAAVFPGIQEIHKKHQVSILRAARRMIASDLNWRMSRAETRGGPSIFYNAGDEWSYGLHRLLCMHTRVIEGRIEFRPKDELRKLLDTDRYRDLRSPPNGAWYREVEIHRAHRDGERERAARLEVEREAARRRWVAAT